MESRAAPVEPLTHGKRRGSRRSRLRGKRGVSDVVATILLLALTVTLFASIFAFVTSFPSPPPQNANNFQGALTYSSDGTAITGLKITHLAGPSVQTNAQIYLKSSLNPGVCPFANPISVGSGISSTVWSLGQTWNRSFTSICGTPTTDPVSSGDNISVYVVSGSQLLYSVVLPGQAISTPPVITQTWVSPSPVPMGSPFTVYATISGSVNPSSVYVNLASIPGLSSTPAQLVQYRGNWVYNSTSGPGVAGSYVGFVNATGSQGETTSAALDVPVTSSSAQLYATLSALPTSGSAPLTVTFAVSQGGGTGPFSYSWSFGDSTTSTTSTGSTTHKYTTTGQYLASVTVTDSKSNVASAVVTINVNIGNQVQGITWSSSNNVNYRYCANYGYQSPTLYYRVWNNWTGTISLSGQLYVNASSGSSQSYSLSYSSLSSGSNTGSVNALGGGSTWTPPGTDTYTLTIVFTVTNKSTGAVLAVISYTDPQTVTVN